MGGYNSLPVQSGRNPYLDEIDQAANNAHAQLSPGAQMALKKAGAPVGMTDTAGPQAPPITTPRPQAPTIGRSEFYGKNTFDEKMPNGQDAMMAGTGIHMPAPSAPRTPIAPVPQTAAAGPAQAELQRLTVGPQATAGVNQIHNPWARVPLQILSAVGETFAPRLAAALPGTESHHQMLVGNAENAVKQQAGIREGEEKAQRNAADVHHLEAESANQESLPDLHQAQAEAAAAKQSEASEHNRAMEAIGQTKAQTGQDAVANKLRMAGYDPTSGEPLPYEQLSEQQQAVHDWKAAQSEQANATAELRRAQAAGEPAKVAIAQQRIQGANNARSIAERRLALSEQREERMDFGTRGGAALPGAILTDEGQPVGTAFQQNVRPTGQERNKADLASSAHEQLQDLKTIVQKRQDIFGPAAGRKTDFAVWLGSQDPDAQAFRAARTIAGDHLAGVFGGRSEAALNALDKAIGQFKDNPKAVIAGLDQLDKANNRFVQVGTPKTVGSNRVAGESVDPKVKAFADEYFSGDIAKAQAEIEAQRKRKAGK